MVKALLKSFGSQSFLIGLGAAAATYFIGPYLKESLRPVMVKGAQGALVLGNQAKDLMDQGKEKVNHMLHEKEASASATLDMILKEMKEEREQYNKVFEELRSSITGLREEITSMKGSEPLQEGLQS